MFFFSLIPGIAAGILCVILNIDTTTASNFNEIVAENYDLSMAFNMNTHTIDGTIIYSFRALQSGVSTIRLDTRDLIIVSAVNANTSEKLNFRVDAWDWELDQPNDVLSISLPSSLERNSRYFLKIVYKVKESATAITWVPKEQTFGKTYAFMYTECQTIHCRSIIPMQDTPAVKSTFKAYLSVQAPYVIVMSAILKQKYNQTGTNYFVYQQDIPVPSYLLAFAIGNLAFASVGKRTGIYTEPEFLSNCTYELADTEAYLDWAEKELIPYVWDSIYNVIILPPSFPFGGMENPYLTFASPSIIIGDRSSANVVAHEIVHSWFGNLVTCKNWSHTWLNEGFTVYGERRIMRNMYGTEYFQAHAARGFEDLLHEYDILKDIPEYTKLQPAIHRESPDDPFTSVPYEKGFQFLVYLESLTGLENFLGFLRSYLSAYSYSSVSRDDFQQYFVQYVQTHLSHNASEILSKINWHQALHEPFHSFPITNFTNSKIQTALKLADDYAAGLEPKNFEIYSTFETSLRVLFMDHLKDLEVTKAEYFERIDRDLNVTAKEKNPEVLLYWLAMNIKLRFPAVKARVESFVAWTGRIKYILPQYRALVAKNREFALQLFQKCKSFYHPLAVQAIEAVLK